MQLHAGLDRNDQYTRNLSDAQGWLGNADNALTVDRHPVAEGQRPRRCRRRTRRPTPTRVQGIATQIDSIRQSLIGVANTQYAGRPIFAGTAERRRRVRRHRATTSASPRRSSATSPRASGSRSTSTATPCSVRPAATSSRPWRRSRTPWSDDPTQLTALQTHARNPDDDGPGPAGARSDRNFFASRTCRAKTLRMG